MGKELKEVKEFEWDEGWGDEEISEKDGVLL